MHSRKSLERSDKSTRTNENLKTSFARSDNIPRGCERARERERKREMIDGTTRAISAGYASNSRSCTLHVHITYIYDIYNLIAHAIFYARCFLISSSRVFFVFSFQNSSQNSAFSRKKHNTNNHTKNMNAAAPPPIALSAVFIVNLRGDVLIERQYRSDISRANIDQFKTEILNGHRKSVRRTSTMMSSSSSGNNGISSSSNKGDVQSLPPVRIVGQIKFMFIRVANVYVCAATKLNVNVSMCFAFLKSAIGTFQVRVVFSLFRAVRRVKREKISLFALFFSVVIFVWMRVRSSPVTDAFFFLSLSLSFCLI